MPTGDLLGGDPQNSPIDRIKSPRITTNQYQPQNNPPKLRSLHLPASPFISPHLPASPCSPHFCKITLPRRTGWLSQLQEHICLTRAMRPNTRCRKSYRIQSLTCLRFIPLSAVSPANVHRSTVKVQQPARHWEVPCYGDWCDAKIVKQEDHCHHVEPQAASSG